MSFVFSMIKQQILCYNARKTHEKVEINHLDWMKRTHSYTKINREIERGGDGVGVEEGDRDVAPTYTICYNRSLTLFLCRSANALL